MAELTISPGDHPTAAQYNSYMTHTGGAWNAWTPVVTQGVGVTVTVSEAAYCRVGRLIIATCFLFITGTGTASTDITVSLPVATKAYGGNPHMGMGLWQDTSLTITNNFFCTFWSSTTIKLRQASSTNVSSYLGGTSSSNSSALANTDVITFQVTYEAAAG